VDAEIVRDTTMDAADVAASVAANVVMVITTADVEHSVARAAVVDAAVSAVPTADVAGRAVEVPAPVPLPLQLRSPSRALQQLGATRTTRVAL